MSVELPLQTIGKTTGPNPGFVRKLWLIDSRQVQHIPDPVYLVGNVSLLVPSRMISFFSQALFYEIKLANKQCTFQEPFTRTEAGTRFSQAIQFPISKVSLENATWLYNNIASQWVCFFQDHNGNVRIVGSPSLPVSLVFSASVSADSSTSVSLSCESAHPAYFTDGMPDLERVFSSGFGESFG